MEIKHKVSGKTLFTVPNLTDADLTDADLRKLTVCGARLCGANVGDAIAGKGTILAKLTASEWQAIKEERGAQ